jgi:uncharacterized protein (DUF1778 family)
MEGHRRPNEAGTARRATAPDSFTTLRSTAEWREWLERAASHSRMSVSGFLDLAAAAYAEQQGFPDPAPER